MMCTCHERGKHTVNVCPVHNSVMLTPGVANPVEHAMEVFDNISDEIGISHEEAEGFVIDKGGDVK